ncbi:MAG: hypothetical protein IT168_20190 [Bryobacterales bacterium]|nr:hypothetical protein [Bryobacterales bacterium]
MTRFMPGVTQSWTYNELGQLTNLSNSAGVNINYTFPTTGNNGRIQSMTNVLTGETVTYQYDALNRLATATSNDPTGGQTFTPWGQSFAYDGFGNLTGQTVTKGSAPQMAITVDPATNRVNGAAYDANGNMQLAGWGACTPNCYDVENRYTGGGAFGYAPDNKQVLRYRTYYVEGEEQQDTRLTFYGIDGKRLGIYKLLKQSGAGGLLRADKVQENVYVAGRLIWQSGEFIVTDRLGSVVLRRSQGVVQKFSYYPYGQEKNVTYPDDREKFATYWRDSSAVTPFSHTLDYADQRYYNSFWGRFASPDPCKASAAAEGPQSWNRYSYVEGDPVNRYDPNGLEAAEPPSDRICSVSGVQFVGPVCDLIYQRLDPGADEKKRKPTDQEVRKFLSLRAGEMMPSAFSAAIQVLVSNSDCMNLFGNEKTRANGFNPVNVLTSIVYGDHAFGHVEFEFQNSGAARVTPNGIPKFTSSATIKINTNPDFWNAGNIIYNAETLLHELGHVYDVIQGSGSSKIKSPDIVEGSSRFNDWLIDTTCFGGVLGYRN